MPQIPEPRGASPDLVPFLRWVRDTLRDMIDEQKRQQQADTNTNSSQNSTMSTLVDRLGTVEQIISTISSSVSIDASQVISGVLADARIPSLDVSKITSGTWPRGVSTGSAVSAGSVSAGSIFTTGDVGANGNGTFNAAWTYNVSAVTRLAVWMDSSGRLGQTSSSEVYKKNIEDFTPNEAAVRLVRLRQFNWDPYYGPNWDHKEVGLIAQQLHNLGLRWLVAYDEKNHPIAIHYDRFALALLPLTQRLADDVDTLKAEMAQVYTEMDDIRARLAALEENQN